jgi:acyl transferase domain-containing protein
MGERASRSLTEVLWLVTREFAACVGLEPAQVDARERFSRYGLDSARATRLMATLSQALGRGLPPTLVWAHPTVEALAAHLAGVPAAQPREPEPQRGERAVGPIAIIGMACRLPGAESPGAFWEVLSEGRDMVREVPPERWNARRLRERGPGMMAATQAGLLARVDQFDPLFFGISPREAAEMDPQQRLFLKLAWEALEDAGVATAALEGSRTGVFVGAIWRDYAELFGGQMDRMTCHTATGQALNMVANRVSYALGLRGPSLVVDTACSSSLVAVHLACQALWSGEASLALAGGINLLLAPQTMVALSRFGGLSPDGRCKAFDARADGFGRGEGGGAVVLKPLERALADGDPVYCVIRATAVNNDGPSNGLTAPSPEAQQDVLRSAYRRAGVPAHRVHYVEAHGTGTALGDPIEASALGAVCGEGRTPERPLAIGSVKTNIGHLEGAAGIAGIIKVALALRHRQLPASLHFEQPNPHIPFEQLGLRVVKALEPWPAPADEPALAGVSSFGWGGTNAHVVMEEVPRDALSLVTLAAGDAQALAERARALAAEARAGDGPLEALAARAAAGDGGAHRLAVAVRSHAELALHLEEHLAGRPRPGLATGLASRRKVAFVCSPQGPQWPGMAVRALRSEPVFRAALARCERALRPHTGWSLLEELAAADAARFNDVDVVQPLLFAVQVALAEQWRAWGVVPDVVVGHSLGEVAAAHISGILSLEDAAYVIHHYSRLQKLTAGRGGMAVVELPADALAPVVAEHAGRIGVAACNGPRSTVLSGEVPALESVLAGLKARGVLCAMIRVNVAAHGPQMDPILEEMERLFSSLRPRPALLPMMSTLTGQALTGPEVDGTYFPRNLRRPVLLAQVMARLLEEGCDTFVELSPNPVLTYALQQCVEDSGRQAVVLGSLHRADDERVGLYDTRARLHALGAVDAAPGMRVEPFPLSARSPEALRELAAATAAQLARDADGASLGDLSYTAGARRAHHDWRLAVAAGSARELREALEAFARGEPAPGLYATAQPRGGARPKVAFVFPGQGSQWLGMARELLQSEQAFATTLRACDVAVRAFTGWSVLEELRAPEERSRLGQVDVIQPVLFAVEVALAAQWRAWGVEPDAVVGHSMGEVAAACVAGALSLEDAARIICERSRLLRRVSGQGAMALVELTLEQARQALAGVEDRVAVAVSNGPRSTVLSGEPEALRRVVASLEGQGIFCRWVKVDVASHSPQMDALREDLLEVLRGLSPRQASVPLCSTVTGEPLDGARMVPEYWVSNLREPVLFSTAVSRLREQGIEVFVEMSPHPILLPSVEQVLQHLERPGTVLPSLRRQEGERQSLLRSLGALYALGWPVDWARVRPEGGRCVPLPSYPWQRERFWLEAPVLEGQVAVRRDDAAEHPLLGRPLHLAAQSGARYWEVMLALESLPYLADHQVGGAALVPGSAFVEMALAAAAAHAPGRAHALHALRFDEALVLTAEAPRRVQCVLEEAPGGVLRLRFFSREEGQATTAWTLHAQGELRPGQETARAAPSPESLQARLAPGPDAAALYPRMAEHGLEYGPAFQGIEQVWGGGDEVLARLRLPTPQREVASAYLAHPALLDAALQAAVAGALGEVPAGSGFLSTGLECVRVRAPAGVSGWSLARRRPGGGAAGFTADVLLLDEQGQVVVEVLGMQVRRLPSVPRFQGAPARRSKEAPVARRDESLVQALKSAEPGPRRRALLETEVRGVVAQVLKLTAARVDLDRPLRSLGIDSIMSVELRNRLEAKLGVTLSATLIWNYPTVNEMVPFLAQRMGISLEAPAQAPTAAPVRPGPAPAPDSAQEPLDALLQRELAALEGLLQQM